MAAVRYSIAYISELATRQLGLTQSMLTNRHGHLVAPSLDAVQTVVNSRTGQFDAHFNADLVDSKGTLSYPIVAYTYLVIRMNTMKNCDSAKELYRYIKWLVTNEEARYLCRENGMVPLDDVLAEKVKRGEYCCRWNTCNS